jgi:hypothetical protein
MSVTSDWNVVKVYWTICSESWVEVWIFTPINTVTIGVHETKVTNIQEDLALKNFKRTNLSVTSVISPGCNTDKIRLLNYKMYKSSPANKRQ